MSSLCFVSILLFMFTACEKNTVYLPEKPSFLLKTDDVLFGDRTSQSFTKTWTPVFDRLKDHFRAEPGFGFYALGPEGNWKSLVEYYEKHMKAIDSDWKDCTEYFDSAHKSKSENILIYCNRKSYMAIVSLGEDKREGGMLPVAFMSDLLKTE